MESQNVIKIGLARLCPRWPTRDLVFEDRCTVAIQFNGTKFHSCDLTELVLVTKSEYLKLACREDVIPLQYSDRIYPTFRTDSDILDFIESSIRQSGYGVERVVVSSEDWNDACI